MGVLNQPARGITHLKKGNLPTMVDIGAKRITTRRAVAEAVIGLTPEAAARFDAGDLQTKKGPVFHTATIAGIQAAKRTWELIPLCHPLPLDACDVTLRRTGEADVTITCAVRTSHRTGVEMEALTGATVAALTVYDMCKSLGHGMVIRHVRLLRKSGGRSRYRAGKIAP